MIDTDKYEGVTRFDLVEQHNIHELAIFLLDQFAEVKRLRGIAKTCLEAIEAGGDIRSGTIELIEHNLKLMELIE